MMDAEIFSNAMQWEAFVSCLEPLLDEGKIITIRKVRVITPGEDNSEAYQVDVRDEALAIISSAQAWPLVQAMSDAYESTPEVDKT